MLSIQSGRQPDAGGLRKRLAGQPELPGDLVVGAGTAVDVNALAEVGIIAHKGVHAEARDLQPVAVRRVGQRQGGGARHGAWHIGYAIVHNAVHFIYGVVVVGRFGGLKAAALVHRHVYDNRSGNHILEVFALDKLRCAGACDQHTADDQIGGSYFGMDGGRGGVQGFDAPGACPGPHPSP